jgi:hypothetical protein
MPGQTFISPVIPTSVQARNTQPFWHDISSLNGNVAIGMTNASTPIIVALEQNKLKLVRLQGAPGKLENVEPALEKKLKMSIRPDGPLGLTMRIETTTNQIKTTLLDYKGRLVVVEVHIPDLPAPSNPPPRQEEYMLDGNIIGQLDDTSSRTTSISSAATPIELDGSPTRVRSMSLSPVASRSS